MGFWGFGVLGFWGWRKIVLRGVLRVWRVDTGTPGGGWICLQVVVWQGYILRWVTSRFFFTHNHLGEKWIHRYDPGKTWSIFFRPIPSQSFCCVGVVGKGGRTVLLFSKEFIPSPVTGDGITRYPWIFRQTCLSWNTKFRPSHRNFPRLSYPVSWSRMSSFLFIEFIITGKARAKENIYKWVSV